MMGRGNARNILIFLTKINLGKLVRLLVFIKKKVAVVCAVMIFRLPF